MLVRILRDRHRAVCGQILEISDGVANVLIRRKIAELYVPPPDKPKPKSKQRVMRRMVVNA